MQNFDRAKLMASLKKAGAKEEHAKKVTETVAGKVREEMATSEIKKLAATELRKMDAAAATKYETSKKSVKYSPKTNRKIYIGQIFSRLDIEKTNTSDRTTSIKRAVLKRTSSTLKTCFPNF